MLDFIVVQLSEGNREKDYCKILIQKCKLLPSLPREVHSTL